MATTATYVVGSGIGTKHCTVCRQSMPASNFHARKLSKDGLASSCKPCAATYQRVHYGTIAGKASTKRRNATRHAKPAVKALRSVRSRINEVVKRAFASKHCSYTTAVGASSTKLMAHLRSMYTGDMTDFNRGTVYETDHILPISCFDMCDEMQQAASSHFTNLQPLSRRENRQKGALLPRTERNISCVV